MSPANPLAIVIDMNLSPEWVDVLAHEGWMVVHWSQVGPPDADDAVIMAWAVSHRHCVITCDLDFTTILALTHATGPSVIQLRAQANLPDQIAPLIVNAIRRFEADLQQGALLVVDVVRSRIRVLPL